MAASRRNFLRLSSTGLLTTATLPFLSAKTRTYLAAPLPYSDRYSNRETLERARQNIERVRKRDVQLTLLDRLGSPIRNKAVQIVQQKSQFLWGDNNWVMASMYRNGMIDRDRGKYYRKRFAEVLNALNTTVYWTERPRNDATKTEDFQGDLRLDDFEESVNWANAHGLVAKGHPLFWTVPKAIPEWAKAYPVETMMKFVEVRIRSLCARYRGRVKVWDAVNEMLWETAPKNLPERYWPYTETTENMADYIGKILRWARAEDPDAQYAINDYGIGKTNRDSLTDHRGDPVTAERQQDRYLALIQRLGDEGNPPDLIGLQTRPAWLLPTEQMALYDKLSEPGIPLTITEFWPSDRYLRNESDRTAIESEEWRSFEEKNLGKELSEEEIEEIRDKFVLDFMTCAFGHPNVDSFYFWGFFNNAVRFGPSPTSGHTLAPIYEKVRKLIHEDWKTSLTATTDSEGRLSFRGFCGDYAARLTPEGGSSPIGNRFYVDRNRRVNEITLKTVL